LETYLLHGEETEAWSDQPAHDFAPIELKLGYT
jgi:hypothetical protein